MLVRPINPGLVYDRKKTNATVQISKPGTTYDYKNDTINFEGLTVKNMEKFIRKRGVGEKLELLFTEKKIQERVGELAKEINEYYGDDDVYIICVMEGAKRFAKDLTKKMGRKINGEVKLASYGGSTNSSGIVEEAKRDLAGIENAKHILVIEDIVDTGNSMHQFLSDLAENYDNASIRLCSFLDKPSRREKDVRIDHYGFSIGDEFVIGYGLDYAQKGRDFRAIYQVVKSKNK